MKKIAIIGGIGSGKSVVSHILRILGYSVYDCDSNAKRIMSASTEVRNAINSAFHEAFDEHGCLNRQLLAKIIFNDKGRLQTLNGIVHPAVKEDFIHWTLCHKDEPLLFVETAILFESKMDELVDEIWNVTASEETRITRVQKRNGLSVQQIKDRIASQNIIVDTEKKVREIVNEGDNPLLLQVQNLVKASMNMA